MKRFLLVIGLVVMMAVSVDASVILAPWSTWEYTFTNPTGNSSWNTTTGGWATGPAPFGNNIGLNSAFDYRTYWPADGSDGNDLWVRTAINLAGYDLSSIRWDLGVDNGFTLYVNGINIAGANAEGYTWRWEYSGAIAQSVLRSGTNVIAVALEDHGGATAFDMQITGQAAPVNPVPEPSTFILFGAGLAGIAVFRKRFKK